MHALCSHLHGQRTIIAGFNCTGLKSRHYVSFKRVLRPFTFLNRQAAKGYHYIIVQIYSKKVGREHSRITQQSISALYSYQT